MSPDNFDEIDELDEMDGPGPFSGYLYSMMKVLYALEMEEDPREYFDLREVTAIIGFPTEFVERFHQRAYDVMESEGYIEKKPKAKGAVVRLSGKGLMKVEDRVDEEIFDRIMNGPEDLDEEFDENPWSKN